MLERAFVKRSTSFIAPLLVCSLAGCGGNVDRGLSSGGAQGGASSAGGAGGAAGTGAASSSGGSGATSGSGGSGATSGSGGSGATGGTASVCPPSSPGVCSLSLVASGALPPVAQTGFVEGPAIATTSTGFVVAHAERNASGAMTWLRAARLGDCGQEKPGIQLDLDAMSLACADQAPAYPSGIGLAFDGDLGLAAMTLPNCGKGAGFLLAPVGADGQLRAGVVLQRNVLFGELALAAPTGALAPGAGSARFELVYGNTATNETHQVERVIVDAVASPTFVAVPVGYPLGAGQGRFGRVATTSSMAAYAGFASSPQLRLVLGPLSPASVALYPSSLTASTHAPWVAMATWNARAVVFYPWTDTQSRWQSAQPGSPDFGDEGTLSMGSSGGALAGIGGRLLIIGGDPTGLTVVGLSDVNGTLMQGSDLPPLPGFDLQGAYDGTRIAAAAGHERLAVAWTTSQGVAAGTPAGGWALFQCAP